MDKEKKKKIIMIILGVVIAVAITIGVIIVVFSFMLSSFLRNLIKQKEDNKYVNVDAVIESVDDGLSAGVRTCTNGDEFLYVDEYVIYLTDNNGQERQYNATKVNNSDKPIEYIVFNDNYIFYYHEISGMCMIDRNSGKESFLKDSIRPVGVSGDGDKVYVYDYSGSVYEIGTGEKNRLLEKETDDEKKNEYVYDHDDLEFSVFLDGQVFSIMGYGNPNYLTDNSFLEGGNSFVTPARTVVKNDEIYLVAQVTDLNGYYSELYMHGMYKFDKEALIKYSPSSNETEIIYLIEDNSEQIVNFSVENNKLYTYSGTEIFVSDLNGENKTKLCDAPEVEKMYFEYVNDQLLIYDENNNLLEIY